MDDKETKPASGSTAAPATPAPDPAPPPAADKDPTPSPHEGVVNEWFNGFRNGPLAQNTELWNLIQSRLPELIADLGKT